MEPTYKPAGGVISYLCLSFPFSWFPPTYSLKLCYEIKNRTVSNGCIKFRSFNYYHNCLFDEKFKLRGCKLFILFWKSVGMRRKFFVCGEKYENSIPTPCRFIGQKSVLFKHPMPNCSELLWEMTSVHVQATATYSFLQTSLSLSLFIPSVSAAFHLTTNSWTVDYIPPTMRITFLPGSILKLSSFYLASPPP